QMGAPEPITAWGKVARVEGRCPDGDILRKGTTFVVSNDRVWPELCTHATLAILDTIRRMAPDRGRTEASARHHDGSHSLEMEVYKVAEVRSQANEGRSAAPVPRFGAGQPETYAAAHAKSNWISRAVISGFMAS